MSRAFTASISRRSAPAIAVSAALNAIAVTQTRPARLSTSVTSDARDACKCAFVEPPCAVANLVQVDAELVEQREMQVRQRSFLRVLDVPASLQLNGLAAGQQHRDAARIVGVALADPRSIHHDHVV